MQNANSDMRRFNPFGLVRVKPAADYSQPELVGEDAIDRCIRDCTQALQRFICVVSHSRGVAQQQDKKDVGLRRELGYPLKHMVEWQVVQPDKIDPIRKRLEFLLKSR